jgi:ferrous iron transport protein B
MLFAGAFFTAYRGLVVFSLYLLGITLSIVMAYIFRRFIFKDKDAPFIMELPPYRLPGLKATAVRVWDRGESFIKRAGTVIFVGATLVWVLANFPWGVEYASPQSVMGMIGNAVAPVFSPLGFGNAQAASALLFGFIAKEVVVGTLGVIYATGSAGLGATLLQFWTPLTAYSFMVMVLLYVPCLATIAAIRRETNSWKWTTFAVGYSLTLAYAVAFVVYRLGLLAGFR